MSYYRPRKTLGFFLCLLFLFTFVFSALARAVADDEFIKALWDNYGLPLNNTPGNSPQQNPKIVNDNAGNFIVLWEDSRDGYVNIYAQKIDETGKLFWAKDGSQICRSYGNQNFPQAIGDGAGGAIVVWQDYRNGNTDIYAQRISATGEQLWGDFGKAVCTAEASQLAPEITTDGQGGAIITWFDYRGGTGEDIFAQRLDSQGQALWEKDGVSVCAAPGTQWYPKVVKDGAGGAIIAWTDGRASSSDNNIYAQRLDATGKTRWAKDGLSICSAPNNQERLVMLDAEDGTIIAWNDLRSSINKVYAQKINRDGTPVWQKDGVSLCTSPYQQADPVIESDGARGAIVLWNDERQENTDIFGQSLSSDGNIRWQADGRPICQAEGDQKKPVIIRLPDQNYLALWEDSRRNGSDLFAQKINGSGIPLWEENGRPIALAPQKQEQPVLGIGSSGDIVVAWQDSRSGNYDIYAQKISPNGSLLWNKTGLIICKAIGSVVRQNLQAVFSSLGEIFLVWEDARDGFFNLYGQKIDKNGRLAWGKDGLAVAKVAANQSNHQLVADDSGGVIVVWEDSRLKDFPLIRAQHLNSGGKKLWPESLALTSLKAGQSSPAAISDQAGGAIVVWQDDRNILGLIDLYAQRLSGKGELLWGKKGKALISDNGNQIEPALLADGFGGAFASWTDFRHGDRNPDIYAQRLNDKGDLLWIADGVLVCGAPDAQNSAKLTRDGEGGIVVAWTDKGGGSYDIYAQRLNTLGKPLWMADGIPICQAPRTQQNPIFAPGQVIVWEDYRYGNWDIFTNAVGSAGKVIWGESGVPVVSLPLTQYAPQAVAWGSDVIIAWEDYRDSKQYEIYLQRLDNNGKNLWPENGVRVKTADGARSPKILTDPSKDFLFIFWEDFTNGQRAIFGQKLVPL
jgi:hypothetical protein